MPVTDSHPTTILAIGIQEAFDEPAAEASSIIVVEGKADLKNEPATGTLRRVSHSAWPGGEEQPIQHGMATYPSAVTAVLNGLGEALTTQMTESITSQPEGASTCVVHTFGAPQETKRVYATILKKTPRNEYGLYNAVLSKFTLDMGNPQGSDAKHLFTPEWMGSIVENLEAPDSVVAAACTDWDTFIGSLEGLGLDDVCKMMHVSGNFLIMGSSAAEIRTNMERLTFDVDFSVDPNLAKKAGRKIARNMQIGMSCLATLKVEMETETNEMEQWAATGGDDETPSTIRPYKSYCVLPTAVKFGCWGPSIEKVVETPAREIEATGTPTNVPTPAGTYTGSKTLTYHVEVTAVGTLEPDSPGEFKWWTVEDEADGGATSAETTGVAMTGEAQTLSNGVTVTWAATAEGCTVGDEYAFVAANYRQGFKVTFPNAQMSVEPDSSGDRAKATVTLNNVTDVGDVPWTLELYTTDAAVYDTPALE